MPKVVTIFFMLPLIVSVFLSVTILVAVKLITDHFLRKNGYSPNKAQVEYQQIQTDLNQVASDLTDIRYQLDDIEPYLLQMEYLKYSDKNKQTE